MKVIYIAIAILVSIASLAYAQSAKDLINDTESHGDVLTYGMGYGQQRYSPLDQINSKNANKLSPAWVYSLNDSRGQESFPLVKEGVMFVTTHNATVALNAETGKQIWKAAIEYPAEAPRVACCGIVNRGAALFDGKLYRTTLDANVLALDSKTGKEIWKSNSTDFKNGYSFTVAPLVADGVVIVGISGGEFGIRGYIEGYDAQTGDRLWRTYTVPAPGEPGSETWPDTDAWQRGGGPAWLTGTYDPELGTVYWGVGNPASFNAALRPGDNLYTQSILALDPKTGAIKWHYQTSPNDPIDHDATNELVLAEIDGKKVLMQASRNGFYYVLDRESGELLAANPFVDRINWAKRINLESGRPEHTDLLARANAGEEVEAWPSLLGGKNWSPMSYNPQSGLAYINTLNFGVFYKSNVPTYRAGVFYFGAEFKWSWPEGDRGFLRAVDPMTGDVKWEVGSDIPRFAGVLSTGGGLVVTGRQSGEFEVFDAGDGEKLYEFNVGTGIVGQPMTWEMNGEQYIAITVGSGAVYPLFSGDERLAAYPPGGAVWAFKLSK